MGLNYNPASVTQGLVYYLDFTNTRCYSGSGNTLINLANGAIGITIVSGITYDTDNRKNLNFNGSSGYMTGNDTNLNFSTSDFTIQTTLKLNGLSNGFTGAYDHSICAGSALTNNSSIFYVNGTGTSVNGIGLWHQPTSTSIEKYTNFQTNKIYNLAVTKRFNVVEFFVDGTSIGTTTTSNNFNFTANGFAIGRWYYPGYEQYLKGNIYDFRAYNRALSIDEIQQNYFAQTKRYYNEENIVTNGLVLSIDPSKSSSYSGVGNTIYDLSGFGNTGALTNGPTFSALNGGSIVYDGNDDYLTIGDKLDFGYNSYSFTCWIKLSSVSGTRTIFSKSVADYQPYRYALLLINNKLRPFMRGNLNDNDVEFDSTLSLSTATWYHITVVYDRSSTVRLYINGALDSSASISHWQNLDIQNPYTFKIASYAAPNDSAAYFMQGSISQFLAHNRVLSQQEILQNFNATRSRFGI